MFAEGGVVGGVRRALAPCEKRVVKWPNELISLLLEEDGGDEVDGGGDDGLRLL